MQTWTSEIEFKKRCYELYQLDWISEHGYSLQDVFNVLRKGYSDLVTSSDIDGGTNCDNDFDAVENYFSEQGFKGEIFACEKEFYACDYQDVDYMKQLLPRDMLIQYYKYSI